MDVGKKIQEAREKKNLSREGLATLLGVQTNTVWRWEKGKRQLRDEVKARIAEVLEIPIGFLFDGLREVEVEQSETPHLPVGEPPVWIDVVDLAACAGNGNGYGEIRWEVVDHYPMHSTILLGHSWRCGKLRIIRIEGRSMEPRYVDGDMILFSDEGAESGDIAIVSWDGRLYIRGFIVERDGTVRLKALNTAGNPDIVVEPGDERLHILGKVLGKVGAFEADRGFWG